MITSNIYNKVLGLALAVITFAACSDTWNDHFENKGKDMKDYTLWEGISQNSNLSNFAKVIKGCDFDKSLASSQVFTVFAPTNEHFSAQEADELIAAYNAEKGKVNEEDNTVIKEFIHNHIAMYNHSIYEASSDSLLMMNGKRTKLTTTSFGNNPILTKNELYSNGILFTIDGKADFATNIFEYLRKDADLDSVSNFFYSNHFYHHEFIPGRSIAGGIIDGKTFYLDSVFVQRNDLFNFLDAELNEEDSTYWMVAPTNTEWKKLLDEYQPYFNYDNQVRFRDSMMYTSPRLAIMRGTIFSRTLNTDAHLTDSARSTNASYSYVNRQRMWGSSNFHYYQYGGISATNTQKPFGPEGIFNGTENIQCTNGQVMKTNNWRINKLNTFYLCIIVEAENRGSIKEISKFTDSRTNEEVGSVTPITRRVLNNNPFYGKVWGDAFVEFEEATNDSKVQHAVTFNIEDVLSNIGYDIYLVTAPALANDSNATEAQRRPTQLKCTLSYHDQDGKVQNKVLGDKIATSPDEVGYILLAEDFKFPCSSWGLVEAEPQVNLTVSTNVARKGTTWTKTLLIDCIMLVPHGIATVDEERFTIEPHGDGDVYYRLKK